MSAAAVAKLKLAYEKLSPNNLEAGLPGREKQHEYLYDFLYERLKIRVASEAKKAKIASGQLADIRGTHLNKTIFVCGVPGTGKTATVMQVLDAITKVSKERASEIHEVQCIYINGQQIGKPDRIYSEMLQQITGEKFSSERAQERLETIFRPQDHELKPTAVKRKSSRSKKPIEPTASHKIVVIDELDLLYSERRQDTFYNLFDWPTTSDSRMLLIAIANAMDLAERFMRGRLASRLGWEKLVFESYKTSNLELILTTRLGEKLLNDCFDTATIKVATTRVGRSTGDARRVLDTCRLAIDKALEKKLPKVSPDILDQIGFQLLDKQRREYIASCPPLQLLVLKSIVQETERFGEDNVDTLSVFNGLVRLMESNKYTKNLKLSSFGYQSLLIRLTSIGMIWVDKSKPLFERSLFLRDSSDCLRGAIKAQQPKFG